MAIGFTLNPPMFKISFCKPRLCRRESTSAAASGGGRADTLNIPEPQSTDSCSFEAILSSPSAASAAASDSVLRRCDPWRRSLGHQPENQSGPLSSIYRTARVDGDRWCSSASTFPQAVRRHHQKLEFLSLADLILRTLIPVLRWTLQHGLVFP